MALQVKRLLKIMKQKDMTQRELARMSGVTEAAMSRYLRGERQPRAEVVANMATALGVTSDYLLGREEDKSELAQAMRLVARNASEIPENVRLELIRLLADIKKPTAEDWSF